MLAHVMSILKVIMLLNLAISVQKRVRPQMSHPRSTPRPYPLPLPQVLIVHRVMNLKLNLVQSPLHLQIKVC